MGIDKYFIGVSIDTATGETTFTRPDGSSDVVPVIIKGDLEQSDTTKLDFVKDKPYVTIVDSVATRDTLPLVAQAICKAEDIAYICNGVAWLPMLDILNTSSGDGSIMIPKWSAGTHWSGKVMTDSAGNGLYRNDSGGDTTNDVTHADWTAITTDDLFCDMDKCIGEQCYIYPDFVGDGTLSPNYDVNWYYQKCMIEYSGRFYVGDQDGTITDLGTDFTESTNIVASANSGIFSFCIVDGNLVIPDNSDGTVVVYDGISSTVLRTFNMATIVGNTHLNTIRGSCAVGVDLLIRGNYGFAILEGTTGVLKQFVDSVNTQYNSNNGCFYDGKNLIVPYGTATNERYRVYDGLSLTVLEEHDIPDPESSGFVNIFIYNGNLYVARMLTGNPVHCRWYPITQQDCP